LNPGRGKPPTNGFTKDGPRKAKGGKPKGCLNKTTISVKNALIEAFDLMGGVPALVKWARMNQTDFYKLWTRLLPIQVTGAEGGPLRIETKHDLARLSIDELSTLAGLVDKTKLARAAGGETIVGGIEITSVCIPDAVSATDEESGL
jgi:hypothetical protein